MPRITWIVLLACAMPALQGTAFAQSYPSKPVRLVVASAPGGGVDVVARIIAPRLSELLAQPVIIDARPGAGGTIGYEQGVRAAPDGYTFTLITPTYTANPSLYRLKFDALADYTPVTLIARFPHVIVVHPSLPARSIHELIALAKSRPGAITYGSSGQGTIVHLTSEVFLERAGITMTHVPYRGGGPALADLIGGQISLVFAPPQTSLPQVKAHRLRALAVTTRERLAAEPRIPTVAESGIADFDLGSWHAMIGPKGLSQGIVERMNRDVGNVLRTREIDERLRGDGVLPAASTAAGLRLLIEKEVALWRAVVARARIKIE